MLAERICSLLVSQITVIIQILRSHLMEFFFFSVHCRSTVIRDDNEKMCGHCLKCIIKSSEKCFSQWEKFHILRVERQEEFVMTNPVNSSKPRFFVTPYTSNQKSFHFLVKRHIFTIDFSNSFCFSPSFEKSWFHCKRHNLKTQPRAKILQILPLFVKFVERV